MLRIIVILLLMVSVAGASPIYNSLDSLRVSAYRMCNIPDAGTALITSTAGNFFVNVAYDRVCRDFPAIEASFSAVLYNTLEGATLPDSFLYDRAVFRVGGDSIRYPLKRMDIDTFSSRGAAESDITHTVNDVTSPGYYYIFGNKLMTHPKYNKPASKADTFLVQYQATGSKISTGSTATSCKVEYLHKILEYTAYLICDKLNRKDEATMHLSEYMRGKSNE